MRASDFDYELPPERIAQVPLPQRDDARLLVDGDPVRHCRVRDLPELLLPGDVVVVNDTRVLPARLHLAKASGGRVEVVLLEPRADGRWSALVRPSRKVAPGTALRAGPEFVVVVEETLAGGLRAVRLEAEGDWLAALEQYGEVPLPPYITAPLADRERYQTVFAERPASAAAPTAGLHLTSAVFDGLSARGIEVHRLELVVGLDTFRPLAVEVLAEHQMHSEAYRVPASTWAGVTAAKADGRRVVAIGTTAVRALESCAASGSADGRTDLFIRRGYPWAVVDVLMTNFHLPRSTLLVLVDAFVGSRWRDLYDLAGREGYRFLSFGDAMLLTRRHPEPR